MVVECEKVRLECLIEGFSLGEFSTGCVVVGVDRRAARSNGHRHRVSMWWNGGPPNSRAPAGMHPVLDFMSNCVERERRFARLGNAA
jgi:hypothetical protein